MSARADYISSEQARNLFWDRDLLCSCADVAAMAKAKIIRSKRVGGPRSPWLVRAADVDCLVMAGSHAWQILGRGAPRASSPPRMLPGGKLSRRSLNVIAALTAKPDPRPSDLVDVTEIELLRIRGCGKFVLNEVNMWMEQHGYARGRDRYGSVWMTPT